MAIKTPIRRRKPRHNALCTFQLPVVGSEALCDPHPATDLSINNRAEVFVGLPPRPHLFETRSFINARRIRTYTCLLYRGMRLKET